MIVFVVNSSWSPWHGFNFKFSTHETTKKVQRTKTLLKDARNSFYSNKSIFDEISDLNYSGLVEGFGFSFSDVCESTDEEKMRRLKREFVEKHKN